MYSLEQAVRASPVLSQVAQRVELSRRLMEVIRPLLPAPLRPHVQAGPVDDEAWCLLVANPAVATKLKQLSPALLAAIQQAGHAIPRLRIKVRSHR
jgi:hypothetical protein